MPYTHTIAWCPTPNFPFPTHGRDQPFLYNLPIARLRKQQEKNRKPRLSRTWARRGGRLFTLRILEKGRLRCTALGRTAGRRAKEGGPSSPRPALVGLAGILLGTLYVPTGFLPLLTSFIGS